MPVSVAKFRRRVCLLESVAVETLERRMLLSVSASTLIGPVVVGQVKHYTDFTNGTAGNTYTTTTEPSTTFNGNSAGDSRTVNVTIADGVVTTTDEYSGTTSSGFVAYGSNSSVSNSSGGVAETVRIVNTPPAALFPASLTGGVVYTTAFSSAITITLPGIPNQSQTSSQTQTVELMSETTSPLTVPAGTFNVYKVDTTAGVTTSAGTSGGGSPTIEYFSPTVGLVESFDQTSGIAEELTSVTNGGGGGGGSGTTGTGALTPLVVKTSLPSAAVAGGKSHGTATVSLTNTGSTAIKESVTTEVFASLDGAVDSSSVLLGSISKVVSARAGATAEVVVTIKSLPASLNGDYTLLAEATDTAGNISSTTGPTVDVTAAFVAFSSEVITTNLGSSLVSGSKTKADATITLTNSGNVESTGTTTVDLFVSPDGTVASGTAIREVNQSIVIQPGKSKTVKVPLEALPNVADGDYQIVAELTDPTGDVTTVATGSSVALAQAFVVLTPVLSAITLGSKGTGTVSLTITNNGNIAETGVGTIALYASATGGIDGSTLLGSKSGSLPLKVGQSKTLKTKLTAAEMEEINIDGLLLAAVTDPLGNVLTASTPAAG